MRKEALISPAADRFIDRKPHDSTPPLRDVLMAHEERFWLGRSDQYRDALDDTCLVAFTNVAGVSSRDKIAGPMHREPIWRDLTMDVAGLVQPTDDVAVLTYRVSVDRGRDGRYRALVSSGYVRRDGGWRMMFHHQTPLDGSHRG